MKSKKKLLIITTIFFIGLVIIGSTYAFWTWTSNTAKNVVFNTANNLKKYIVYDEGESTFSGNFEISSSFNQGMHSTISMYKTSEAANVDLVATINMKIDEIGPNMANSRALKWKITSGTITNIGNELASGNFIGKNSGDIMSLVYNIPVTSEEEFYTIWIWLDAAENPSSNLTGETLDTHIWVEINQIEGIENIFEIRQIDVNYQTINANVINTKNTINYYAVTTEEIEPVNWITIPLAEQKNSYSLIYDAPENNTYYIWFKDSANNIIHDSVEVTEVDDIPPTGTISAAHLAGGIVTATVTATDGESGLAPTDTYGWKISTNDICDDTITDFIISNSSSYTFNTDTAQTYYACVRIKDKAGNYGYVTSMVKAYLKTSSYNEDFKANEYKEKITSIHFLNTIDTSNAIATFDMSASGDNVIVGWLQDNGNGNNTYDLKIGSNSAIYAKNLNYFFASMPNVSNIDISLLNTSEVTNMASAFTSIGSNATNFNLNLGNNFDTSNVINMAWMFGYAGQNATNFSLNLGNNFDTSNVRDMSLMFYYVGTNTTNMNFNLGNKFNTSNVTDMYGVFSNSFTKVTNLNLDLGNYFDTANVTNMSTMFDRYGMNSTNLSLNLGNKFNTAKVTDMKNMFSYMGFQSSTLNLNLGNNFDAGNVKNMYAMFYRVGEVTPNLSIHLGNNFNASNANNMAEMFSLMGSRSNTFNLNLGNNFNLGQMTVNINQMFGNAGNKAINWSLDLGNNFNGSRLKNWSALFAGLGGNATNFNFNVGAHFNTINATNMYGTFATMATNAGTVNISLGNHFNTAKVTDMSMMFGFIGGKATNFNLNLGNKFNMSNVTNTYLMFHGAGKKTKTRYTLDLSAGNFAKITNSYKMFYDIADNYVTIYVKDSTARSWILNNADDWGVNFSASNVLIK